ncbi:MAG: 4Fe-4S binding protein [Methanomassiliicoccaceae archaeon]|nr:4Fe-4S binding protein [Methanomassiliicoccaceae archaeon]
MKKGPFRRSIANLFSFNVTTENQEVLFAKRSVMPFAGEECDDCGKCADICPSKAIVISQKWTVDIGKCILCKECISECPANAISLVEAPDYALKREDLIFRRGDGTSRIAGTLDGEKLRTMRRSVNIREVDTGSCNACEVEVNMLANPFYDMERFGIRIVASPRHADMLLVTGPLTENMYNALIKAVAAAPDPKIIVAMGSCAISGGVFADGTVIGEGINDTVNVNMFIPGCPPAPDRLLRAMLSALGRKPTERQ